MTIPNERQSYSPSTDDETKAQQQFRMRRRRIVTQILCNPALSSKARVIGWCGAEMAHWKTGSACPSDMTIAKRTGLMPHEVRAGIDELLAERHFRMTKRDNGVRDLHLLDRPDLTNPFWGVKGVDKELFKSGAYRKFRRTQDRLIEQIFGLDADLKPADRVIGYGLVKLVDLETLTTGAKTCKSIGDIMGLSSRTARRSIGALVQAGFLYKADTGTGRYLTLAIDPASAAKAATPAKTPAKTQAKTPAKRIQETPYSSAFPQQSPSESLLVPLSLTTNSRRGLTSAVSDSSPSAGSDVVFPPSCQTSGNEVRELVQRHGYLTKAGITISASELVGRASRNGGCIVHLIDLIERGFLADVDQDGNVTTTGDMFVAITEPGRDTATWPDPEEELWPDLDAIADENEQGESLPPLDDYDDDRLPAVPRDQEQDSRFERSDEWASIRHVLENHGCDGRMTLGGIISCSANFGLGIVVAHDVLKAARLGFLTSFKLDGTPDRTGRYFGVAKAYADRKLA